jgi:thioredoxin 1
MSEIILTDANFEEEVLKSTVPVFVDFWAEWCGPCQMMGPIVEQLASEYDAVKVKIAKANVDDNQILAGKYEVMSIPTFIVFKNGGAVDKIIGGVTKEKLKEMIDKSL